MEEHSSEEGFGRVSGPAAMLAHREGLLACRLCPEMVGPVVAGPAVQSKVLLLGQAPGPHEGEI